MKIAFLEVSKSDKIFLRRRLPDDELIFINENLNEENIKKIKDCEVLSVFIYSQVNKKNLDKLLKLKLITTRSTGFDHIDAQTCKNKGISICNVPFYGENTVAEHTFALILALSRNVHKSYLRTLRRDYSTTGLMGFDLKGKTLGVIGAGRIGLHVIRIAKGFGMNVLAFDLNRDKFISEILDFSYGTIEEVLKASDIITLHVPYNKYTHHLINKDNLRLVKKGAILINTARGGIIETQAIIEALDKGLLSGVGIDVLEGEEMVLEEKKLNFDEKNLESMSHLIQDHILLSRDNVVFTPHIGFYSKEALERILETTVESIEGFKKGNLVNSIS
ncbi:MAG: D-isomer specific 2-hydroxyacid dehydrogenase NAD-binding protein [Candidatus Peregrinibacteria bacterium GW2011_GWA2_33_10]|nr:MAG: D-isomer specific 2-hydroxyacid dehydrogenase NAD-binding protein [Candidatus Peregrinibacteria bacterium GW2011_GWA2_33_10]KKP39277.1 MAG: D-isomer specific 2-hydroxyacid dehydrogenase NAD-binding protein, D-lactate dehydrogenase [Candidatus Peregrinibacteria bacterium GW2011_GWC2_33_13]OGJ49960.1 MAG: hydroxyacid dehydrogenase [Candidatus Peregrinibacteria bacterium RIFOXYA2_FULL_33_7]